MQSDPRVIEAYLGGTTSEEEQRVSAMLEVKDLEVVLRQDRGRQGHLASTSTQGQVVTLIGTNGAGKTTTLRTISGLLRPRPATITFQGKPIDGIAGPRHRRSSGSPTPPRAGGSSRGSPSRRT